MATLLPVAEAAQALGISVSALRRGLKSGRYHGERQSTPQGFVWLVEVDGDRVGEVRVGEHRTASRRRPADAGSSEEPAGTPQMALQAQRAEEMARYTAVLLAPLHARLEAQAEELGALKERLATAQARITELEAPPDVQAAGGVGERQPQEDATPETPERRPWWQRAWRLVAGD